LRSLRRPQKTPDTLAPGRSGQIADDMRPD
jgi:hypothetical protein